MTDTPTDETDEQPITRRRVLRATGAAAGVAAAVPGGAAAHLGKGISWVAFCGCTDFCIRYRRYDEEGELGALAYRADGCTVYYKAGRNIYEHRHTRRTDVDWEVIETDYAGGKDPDTGAHPSASRDPCGIIDESSGTKLEREEIESHAYDCHREDGT